MWQANRVREELERNSISVEIVPINTSGDKNRTDPIGRLGAPGAFTKEIQRALLDGRIDLAVHSLKDLPTDPIPGLLFAATLDRADRRDVFVSRKYQSLRELPAGSVIGTGSLRRKCQLIWRLKGRGIRIDDIRGNVETRLKKLDAGEYDAVVLAAAGLSRLGFNDRITESGLFDSRDFFPAVGQGALGLECRESDTDVREVLARVNRAEEYYAVTAERSFLRTLRGGCVAPIGASAFGEGSRLFLNGRILSLDGSRQVDVGVETELSGDFQKRTVQADELGILAAQKLSSPETESILAEIRDLRTSLGR